MDAVELAKAETKNNSQISQQEEKYKAIYYIFIRDLDCGMVIQRNYKLQVDTCKGVILIQQLKNQLSLQHCRFRVSKLQGEIFWMEKRLTFSESDNQYTQKSF